MNVFTGPQPAPQPDRTNAEARHELAEDIRALNHTHPILAWGIFVETGDLLLQCGCDQRYRRASDPHFLNVLRKARGLDKLPKPK